MYRSKKNVSTEVQAAGQDSFLDVVANIVGILIIMTAIVGARVQQAISNPDPIKTVAQSEEPQPSVKSEIEDETTLPELPSEAQKLQAAELNQLIGKSIQQAESLGSQAVQLKLTIDEVQAQTALLNQSREQIAMAVELGKREIKDKRDKLSENEKEKFDLQQKIAQKKSEMDEMEKSIGYQLSKTKPSVKKLECYPTAISRPVDKSEVWLQLKGGRVANIPSERLIEAYRNNVTSIRNSNILYAGGKVNATVGPFDGFVLEGVAWTEDKKRLSNSVRFIPISDTVGETIDEAMESMNSQFLKTLKQFDPRTTVITVWVYEDSFAEFQEIEKYLYDSGYRVASRPLPKGEYIGAGPNGSRSAAQ